MNRNGFRWTRLCVSATTALITGCAWNIAGASQTHTLQHGETLASIARHYHVSVQDIVSANALANPNSVRDGHRLIIPDPPKRLVIPAILRKAMAAKSDRVNVRLGPGADYRSIWTFDKGAAIVVTAEKDGWAQVALPDGRNGWVRHDFLKTDGAANLSQQTKTPKQPDKAPKPAPVVLTTDRSRRTAATKPAGSAAGSSRKHQETQHPPKLAHTASHTKQVKQAAHHSSHVKQVKQVAHHANHQQTHYVAHHSSHHNGNSSPEANAPDSNSDIVRTAYSYRGTPYHYGSSGRGSFDCSGFTSYLYSKKGVSLPHSAKGQFEQGHKVSRGEMKPGDLVFFHTVTSGISHVGMYVGDGKFVHCSSRRSGGVRVDNLDSGYYSKAFRGARRVKE